MTDDYEALISQYRSKSSRQGRFIDVAAYILGFCLVIAPFIRPLAVPMAVFSLVYFGFVFSSLVVWDLTKIVRQRLQNIRYRLSACLQTGLESLDKQNKFYLEAWERFFRNALALVKTRALWETLFFSPSIAKAKGFFNSAEKKIGS